MSDDLAGFFAQMKPFLRGEIGPDAVEARLGPAQPDTESLGFYATLMERNAFKAMRELHPAVPAAAERHRPGLWAELVRGFVKGRAPGGRHPDGFGVGFAQWLAERRDSHEGEPVFLVEIADFHAAQLAAATAPEPAANDDGFDRSIFVRLYTHPIPAIVRALLDDPAGAELPGPALTPLVIYRRRGDDDVRLLHPRPAALVALARRAGIEVPAAFDLLPAESVAAAERGLVAEGILSASPVPKDHP